MSLDKLENKAVHDVPSRLDMVDALNAFMASFETFKQSNDERMAQIEAHVSPDVVTLEKIERINRALDEQKQRMDELSLKASRPRLFGDVNGISPLAAEHKAAFDAYMRRGEIQGLATLESKALSIQSDPDGGYLVPDQMEREIGRVLSDISPIRSISAIRHVSGSVYKKPFAVSGAAVGWVGETESRPQTAAPSLAELQFPTMELYAMPAASSALLDDSVVNIDEWIAQEVRDAFAEQEGAAFVNGDGVKRPRGFLHYPKVVDASWSWGRLGFLATGVDGHFPDDDPSDKLIDLVHMLRSGYRANAHWVMNRSSQGEIRKIKDANGNYIWQPASQAGGKATLMGFPIAESEDMPDLESRSHAVALGDFSRGYLIVDRMGVRVLRDPYTAKPHILFYTTKRVGGGVQDFNAIKLLKFAAS